MTPLEFKNALDRDHPGLMTEAGIVSGELFRVAIDKLANYVGFRIFRHDEPMAELLEELYLFI